MDHLGALRVSLLLAIGVVPVACGDSDDDPDGGGTGGSNNAGAGPTAPCLEALVALPAVA